MPRLLPRPTDAELEILRVLWDTGPATVREVQERLDSRRAEAGRNARPNARASARGSAGYTTVLKQLQIMTEKGLVERDESDRAHVYRASLSREATESQLVGDLLDRAFGGSAARLVMRALAAKPASRDEIGEIRRLLAEAAGATSAGRREDEDGEEER